MSKVPNELIKFIFKFFKPRELANMKLTAHRYNELAKKVEAEAEAALLSRFDNEVQVIAEELKSVNSGMDGNFVTDMITKAKKIIIIKSSIDDEYCSERLTDMFNRYCIDCYECLIQDLVICNFINRDFMNDYLNTAIEEARDIKKDLKIFYPILDKLIALTNNYRDHYCNSILQHYEFPGATP